MFDPTNISESKVGWEFKGETNGILDKNNYITHYLPTTYLKLNYQKENGYYQIKQYT